MRTRSQPLSPNGLVSLDSNPQPRRRRTTRATSSQPPETEGVQSTEDAQPTDASKSTPTAKARKPRAKKSSRGRKRTNTRTARTESPEEAPEQAREEPAEHNPQDWTMMADTRPAAVMHSVEIQHVDQNVEEAGRAGAEVEQHYVEESHRDDPIQSVELPIPIFSSVENSVHVENTVPAKNQMRVKRSEDLLSPGGSLPKSPGKRRKYHTLYRREHPPRFHRQATAFRFGRIDDALVDIYRTRTPEEIAYYEARRQEENSWAEMAARDDALAALEAAHRAEKEEYIKGFQNKEIQEDLDSIEELTRLTHLDYPSDKKRPRRDSSPPLSVYHTAPQTPTRSAKRPRASRTAYADIAQRRRVEATGRIDRTVYRLPEFLEQNDETDAPVESSPDASQNATTPPGNAQPNSPAAPATEPAGGHWWANVSPRWVFNEFSRRWTGIRRRLTTRPTQNAGPAPNQPLQENVSPSRVDNDTPPSPETPSRIEKDMPFMTPAETPAFRNGRPFMTTAPRSSRRAVLSSRASDRKRSYSLYPSGYSKEQLDHWYGRDKKPIEEPVKAPVENSPSATAVPPEVSASATARAVEASAPVQSQSKKRKRRLSPDQIPNPAGCSYGMDMDYFTFDSDDEMWAEEEMERRAAMSRKTAPPAEEPAPTIQEPARPAPKKVRIEEPNKSLRPRDTPRRTVPPRRAARTTQAPKTTQAPNTTQAASPPFQLGVSGPSRTFQTPYSSSAADDASEPQVSSNPPFQLGISGPSRTSQTPYSSSTGDEASEPRSPGFIPNPQGTFRTPYSSDSDVSDSDVTEMQDSSTPRVSTSSQQVDKLVQSPNTSFDDDRSLLPTVSREPTAMAPPSRVTGAPSRLAASYDRSIDARSRIITAPPGVTGPSGRPQPPEETQQGTGPTKDRSPLTRVRTAATKFNPKTPSRLRAAHRFSSSTCTTPSFFSDPMSICQETPSQRQDRKTRLRHWFNEICPTGDLSQIQWPEPRPMYQTLGFSREVSDIVDRMWEERKDEVQRQIQAFNDGFERFERTGQL